MTPRTLIGSRFHHYVTACVMQGRRALWAGVQSLIGGRLFWSPLPPVFGGRGLAAC